MYRKVSLSLGDTASAKGLSGRLSGAFSATTETRDVAS